MTKKIEELEARIKMLENIVNRIDAGLIATAKQCHITNKGLHTHAHDMLAMKTYSSHSIDWTGTALWHEPED